MHVFIFLLFILVNINLAHAENVTESTVTKIPAAWVWEIKTEERTIYLLGEMHAFLNIQSEAIDFELGKKIYEKTIATYTEQQTFGINSPYFTKKLSAHLGSVMWQKLGDLLTTQLLSRIKKSDEIQFYKIQLMNELDDSTVATAEANIRKFASIASALKTKTKLDMKKGLTYRLYDIDKNNTKMKLISLEDAYALDTSWHDACNTDELAQEYIGLTMPTFDYSIFSITDKLMNFQNLYATKFIDLDKVHSYWANNFPESKLFSKCNISPRNKIWFKTLSKLMHERGEPISVVVGLMHIGGDEGLLEMFKKNGATSIRRIYSLND